MTEITPVGTAQVGCVMFIVAADGAVGWALTVTGAGKEMHVLSVVLLTRIACEPAATPENAAVTW
jgi:hypothetical protein